VEVQLLIDNQVVEEEQQLLEQLLCQVHQGQVVLVLQLQFLRPLQLIQVEAEAEVVLTLPIVQGVEVLVEEALEDVDLVDLLMGSQED
jgi:hypothetical protein